MGSQWDAIVVVAVLLVGGISGPIGAPAGHEVFYASTIRGSSFPPDEESVALELPGTPGPAQTSEIEIGLRSPFNYAVLPPGEPIRLLIEDTPFDHLVYTVDGGDPVTIHTPFEIDTSTWPTGFRVLRTEAVRGETVVGARTFAFTINADAIWPPDSMRVDIVLIGIDVPPDDLRVRLSTAYDVPTRLSRLETGEHTFEFRFDFSVRAADAAYRDAMLDHLRSVATYRTDLQAQLDLTALIAQRDDGVARDIFDPLVGWEIPAATVEAYLARVPPVPAADAHVTFYFADFRDLDDPAAGVDHWFVRPTRDPDTERDQDWWRLEWDNDLNTPIGYPLNVFGGPGHRVFVDPTAYQWYIDWAHIWWGFGNGPSPASAQYETVAPADQASYLAGIVNDLVTGLTATLPSAPPHEPTLTIRSYVLSGSEAFPLDDLRWVVTDTLLEDYLGTFLPRKTWQVATTFARVEDYPELRAAVDENTTFDGSIGGIDGGGVWTYLSDHRSEYVSDDPDAFEILTVNFLYDNRSMVFGGREFTGLGGSGITAIFLRTDRLFYADGSRQKGLTSIVSHETGHNLGYGHQFGPNYRADFADGNMGYFRNELEYGMFWEDALHRVYVRERLLRILALLDELPPLLLEPEFRSFYASYRSLDFLAAFRVLDDIESVLNDVTPPTVQVLAPTSGGYVPTSDLVVKWTATDSGSGLSRIEIDVSRRGTVRLDATAVRHILEDLPDDDYVVIVRAVDRAENAGSGILSFRVDTTSPQVTILAPTGGAVLRSGNVTVTWATLDASPITRTGVSLDDENPVILDAPASQYTLAGIPAGAHRIRVTAVDAAGHEGSASVDVRVEAAPPMGDVTILVGSAVAAGGAAAAVAWLLHRRRGPRPKP